MLTDKNPSYFYDPKDFEHLLFLEDLWEVIQKEVRELLKIKNSGQWLSTFPDYVNSKNPSAWEVYTFQFFKMDHIPNREKCKQTSDIIRQIPELISCDFSILKPETHIKAHCGYSKLILRCHLPLIVPSGDTCQIRVGDEIRTWREGELLIFNDSYEHEAWNNSEEHRVILMFDIPNPHWHYSAHEISKYKIDHIADPFLLQFADKATWQEGFKKGILPLSKGFGLGEGGDF